MDNKKIAEINYPLKLDVAGQNWLRTKPYGSYNAKESVSAFQDFSTILFLINKYCPKAKMIMELGCGPGWLSIMLSKMGYDVRGYDISEKMIEVAMSRAAKEDADAKFEVSDMDSDLIDGQVGMNDVIIIYDALHHCPSDYPVLEKAYNYLKKGGILIVAEPNIVHSTDADALGAVKDYGVTERGISHKSLLKTLKQIGFSTGRRYHASGQNFNPRNETLKETLKMLLFPALTRFYYGRRRTRVWVLAVK